MFISHKKRRSIPVILMPFCTSSCQPRQSVIVLHQSRRYIADARNAYNYSRSALWGLGGGLAWLQSRHWFLMDAMPQSWCSLQGGQATIRKGTEGCTVNQVVEVRRERWPLYCVWRNFDPQCILCVCVWTLTHCFIRHTIYMNEGRLRVLVINVTK